jgi:hypothetical protein
MTAGHRPFDYRDLPVGTPVYVKFDLCGVPQLRAHGIVVRDPKRAFMPRFIQLTTVEYLRRENTSLTELVDSRALHPFDRHFVYPHDPDRVDDPT